LEDEEETECAGLGSDDHVGMRYIEPASVEFSGGEGRKMLGREDATYVSVFLGGVFWLTQSRRGPEKRGRRPMSFPRLCVCA
jgi:hypothetical protein